MAMRDFSSLTAHPASSPLQLIMGTAHIPGIAVERRWLRKDAGIAGPNKSEPISVHPTRKSAFLRNNMPGLTQTIAQDREVFSAFTVNQLCAVSTGRVSRPSGTDYLFSSSPLLQGTLDVPITEA